ncbi:hypothetical protein GCM10022240_17080 [Microbacterium kribbense]|uniref:Carbohydrate kinase FGGY N-terminal domain-containing protein n=1 Tax=Microbacterium kribbense TaxID=433645 RepID=A0ABP7GK64_9MICO
MQQPAPARPPRPAKATLVAGLDVTRDGCLAVICDVASGARVRIGRARTATPNDPAGWWQALHDAIIDAGGFGDVSAFALAAHPGLVALDAQGEVVHADSPTPGNPTSGGSASGASARAAQALIGEIGADALIDRTGALPDAATPIAAVRALREQEPDAAARVDAVLTPHDWLTWLLRGFGPQGPNGPRLEELATDRSEASATGWWNPTTGKYEHALVAAALGHAAIKPRVMRPDGWGGEAAKWPELHIRTARVIGAGATRRAAAVLGAGVRGAAPEDAIVLLGARPVVCAVADEPIRDAQVACRADATGRYLLEAPLPQAPTAADVAAAALLLREAGTPVKRLHIIVDDSANASAAAGATGPTVTLDPAEVAAALDGAHPVVPVAQPQFLVADGMAAQAAWAHTRRLPQWMSVVRA